ncbi:hypothetical protein ASPZODRAFT_134653 [Penicilliopsis zonata CBS 506.65]|uniref:EVE domain-containing protein n=1 Tax=Penicilliopsis zonata CBS 506.65 TaxID=1073090 RepID=A0A1L9SBV2_9EURO|nr:hypothetical protein ASPZODRAFT_134653 [Penicilliopsis zonata CBS 506.65]OJJ44567.1 hypothetical protein ASPZODRAFT_134653 [Penicilliopsis zonata CBS 506.65]
MPTRKRKSEGVAVADDVDATPAKRARKPSSGSAESQPEEAVSQPTTPGTEKKGRGRPRKYPPAPPKDPNEPKRGRGRPRKFPLPDGQTAPTPKEKKYPGRGRPRKSIQAQNGDEAGGGSAAEEANQAETDINVDSDASGRSYWLMKAEPESRFEKGVDVKFSIDDLRNATEPEAWDGVRNPVARNLMRNMKKGDHAFFYHSNCKTPGIVGLMEIVREHSVDGLSPLAAPSPFPR